MKKIYAVLIIPLCLMSKAHGQNADLQVISSGGNYVTSPAGSLSYTIGETVTPTLSGGGHILTQGFQQPNDIINGLLDVDKEAFGSFSVYPIPAIEKLWYGYEFPTQGVVKVELYTTLGQKLDYSFSEAYTSGKVSHSFDCTPYAAGQYIISATFTADDNSPKVLSKQFVIIN